MRFSGTIPRNCQKAMVSTIQIKGLAFAWSIKAEMGVGSK